jgi:hypothetical protein
MATPLRGGKSGGAHPAVAHTRQAYFLSFTRVVFTFTREKIRVF